jgi:LysM repeat protein
MWMGRGKRSRGRADEPIDGEERYASRERDAYWAGEQDDAGADDAWREDSLAYERRDPEARALVPRDERALAPYDEPVRPVVIAGSGVPMGNPFIKRRERPLTMRLTIIAVVACIVATGLFAVMPLGADAGSNVSTFQALSAALVVHGTTSYHWYVAQPGDDLESIANKFNVQVGGIIELNNLPLGQEIQEGVAYKIPDDPFYGANYRPNSAYPSSGNGSTTFGSDWWNSYAGAPLPYQPCAPNGGNNPLGYHLQSPNWGSYWVRGYSWFHNGVDIAANDGNPIHAAQYGVVVWAGYTATGFGYSVVISHCYYLSTLYGHMSKLLVHAGQTVVPGQVIGLEGMTGWATGPHLHLSVLVHNQFVNPMLYFASVCTLTTAPSQISKCG